MREDKTRGRPMDKGLDRRITEAAWGLVCDSSLNAVTIQQIAKRAGVSRPAIYRRWSSAPEIVIAAFLNVVEDAVPMPEEADPDAALRSYIASLVRFLAGPVGRIIAELLGRAQGEPELLDQFHDKFLKQRRAHGRALIERGQRSGCFRADIDAEAIIDLYAGPIYFQAFSRHGPLDAAFADALATLVLAALHPDATA